MQGVDFLIFFFFFKSSEESYLLKKQYFKQKYSVSFVFRAQQNTDLKAFLTGNSTVPTTISPQFGKRCSPVRGELHETT